MATINEEKIESSILFDPKRDNGLISEIKELLDMLNQKYNSASKLWKPIERIRVKHGLKNIQNIVDGMYESAYIPASLLVEYRYYLDMLYGSNYRSCLRLISDNTISFKKRITDDGFIVGTFTIINQKRKDGAYDFLVNSHYLCSVGESLPVNFTASFAGGLSIINQHLDKAIDEWYYDTSIDAQTRIEIIKSLIHKEILDDIHVFMLDMIARTERVINS